MINTIKPKPGKEKRMLWKPPFIKLFITVIILLVSVIIAYGQDRGKIQNMGKINMKELYEKEKRLPIDSLKKQKFESGPEENLKLKILPIPRAVKIIRSDVKPGYFKIDTSKQNELKKKNPSPSGSTQEWPGGIGGGFGIKPPDMGGAVSSGYVVETINTQIIVFSKTGTVLTTVSLAGFFASIGTVPDVFDPHVVFDTYQQRWTITAAVNRSSAAAGIVVAVSDNADPTLGWSKYFIDADAANNAWFDFPMIGINKNWIVITGNLYSIAGGAIPNNAIAFVLDKAAVYGGTAPAPTIFFPAAQCSYPAWVCDNTTNDLKLVADWNGNSGGNGFLGVYTISGTPSAPAFSAVQMISVTSPWGDGGPGAPQQGSAVLMATNDSRMEQVVMRNGSLWCAHTVFLPAAAPTHSAVQWWQINVATLAVQQLGRIEDGTATLFYAFPSIDVNAYNDVLVGFSRFAAAQFGSANYAYHFHTDVAGTMNPDVVFKAGIAKYDGGRWGDYSSSITDPDLFSFWTLQEYAETPSGGQDRWGIEWNHVILPVAELYSKDTPDDAGAEPNPTTSSMWQSDDIWIRKTQDPSHAFAHMHEDAEYRTVATNPNYVYVEVHNRGGAPSTGTDRLNLYWAKAGSSLSWADSWDGTHYFDPGPNTMLLGQPIGNLPIPAIAPGASAILEFSWMPPFPDTYTGVLAPDKNHFCLLARIQTSTTAPFGMTLPETSDLYSNVQNNNNIVWKNIEVYNLNTPDAPSYAVVGNFSKEPMKARLKFEIMNDEGINGLLNKGTIRVTTAGKLKEILKGNRITGEGVKDIGDGIFEVNKDGATLDNIMLQPNDYGTMKMEFIPNDKKDLGKGFAITITQIDMSNGNEHIIGGQTLVYGKVKGFGTSNSGAVENGTGSFWHWWYWILIFLVLLLLIFWWWRK